MITDSAQKKDLTIFISGLPYTATEEEIQQFFSECGEITEMKLPRFQDSGRLLGYGHITFADEDARKKALELNNQKIGGRYIDIKPAKGENARQVVSNYTGADATKTIFVKNLPYDITEDEVGDLFRHCGAIDNVRLVYHPFHKHFKGFGYVDFKVAEASKVAVKLSGKEVKGRKIVVDLDYKAPKQGYRYNTEDKGNKKYNQDVQQILKKTIKKKKTEEKKHVQLGQKQLDNLNKARSEAKSQLF